MNPRLAPICGGTALRVVGHFPTDTAVYVWFGEFGPVVPADVTATALTLNSPSVLDARIVDVTVRFQSMGHTYKLTLTDAFTYFGTTETCSGTGSTTTNPVPAPPLTTTPAATAPGATSPPNTAPIATNPASTAPKTTVPATSAPGATGPGTAAPPATAVPATTTPPATAVPATTVPTAGGVVGLRGVLTLRNLPSGGALAKLSAANWPATGCHQVTCAAARL